MTLMFEVSEADALGADTENIYTVLSEAIVKHDLPVVLPYGKKPHGTPYSIPVPAPGAGPATRVWGLRERGT